MSTNTKGKTAAVSKPAAQTGLVTLEPAAGTPAAGAEAPGGQAGTGEPGTPGGAQDAAVAEQLGNLKQEQDNSQDIAQQVERQAESNGPTTSHAAAHTADDVIDMYDVHAVILHNDRPYRPGGVIHLSDDEAAPLLKIGAIAKLDDQE